MLYFHTQFNSIFLDLVCFWLDPSFLLHFGHLQGTTPTLCTRSGATTWTKWTVRGATTCNLLTRSDAVWETLCQHLKSVVPSRHHSKALFPYFSLQKFGFYCSQFYLSDLCYWIWCLWFEIFWFTIDLSGISKVWLSLLTIHPLLCLLVVFTKGFLVF